MKKGLIYLFIFIFLTSFTLGVTVNLIAPIHQQSFTSSNNVDFQCNVDLAGATLNKLELHTNVSGSFSYVYETTSSNLQQTTNNITNGTYKWNCKADTNQGIFWSNSNYTFTVNTPKNSAPSCTLTSQDTNIILPEDSEYILNLDSICSDPDGDSLSYGYNGFERMVVSVTDGVVTIVPELNWNGISTGYFEVSDGNSGTYTSPGVTFNITPVNDAPTLDIGIPNQTFYKNQARTLDMNDFFSDVDSPTLSYTISSLTNFNYSISGNSISFVSIGDWTGNENCVITASDGNLTKQSNLFTLRVLYNGTTNSPPTISSLQSNNFSIENGEIIILSITKYDGDGDMLITHWYMNGKISLEEVGDNYTFKPTKEGNYEIKVKVSDSLSYAEYIWNVNVVSKGSNLNQGSANGNTNLNDNTQLGNEQNDQTNTPCSEGYEYKDGSCIRVKKANNMVILISGILVFLFFAGGVIWFFKWRQDKKLFGEKKEKGIVTVIKDKANDMLSGVKPPEFKYVEQTKMEAHKPGSFVKGNVHSEKLTTGSNVMLRDYIKKSLSSGKSYEQIKKDLINVGWKGGDIDTAYKDLK